MQSHVSLCVYEDALWTNRIQLNVGKTELTGARRVGANIRLQTRRSWPALRPLCRFVVSETSATCALVYQKLHRFMQRCAERIR